MFQPKLITKDKTLEATNSHFLNGLQEALFTHFQQPYKAPDTPFSFLPECNNVQKYVCQQCKDCFYHQSSLDEHKSRGSWILGYWCVDCYKECEHYLGKKLCCAKCMRVYKQKIQSLKSRGLRDGSQPGVVKIFFNPCQLLEHMQIHNSDYISTNQLMLLPFPSGIGKENFLHLKMISEALMDYMFIKNVHIVDWLFQNNIQKWWRMAKGDNPIASIIQKYPFDHEKIKQLLQCNSRIDQIRNTPVERTNLSESQPSLSNSQNDSLPDTNVTFVDCGSRNNSDDDNDVTYLSSSYEGTILNSTENDTNPNDSSRIFVKNFVNRREVPSASQSQETTSPIEQNDGLSNSQVLKIRSNKPVTLSTVIKKFPQVAEQVANKKILFIRKSLSKCSEPSTSISRNQVSLLKPEILRQLNKKKKTQLKEQCKSPVLELQDIYKCKRSNQNQPVSEKTVEYIDLESTATNNDLETLPDSETTDTLQSLATFSQEQMDSYRSILLNQSLNLRLRNEMISIDESLDPVLDKLNKNSCTSSDENRLPVLESLKNNCSSPFMPEGRKSISNFNSITKRSENLIGIPHISSNLDYFLLYNLICHIYRTFQSNKNRFSNCLKYDQLESFYNCPECNGNFTSFLDLKIHSWTECYQSLVRRFLSYNICKVDGLLSLESILKLFEIVHSSKTSICKMCCTVFAYYCESRLTKRFLELNNFSTKQSVAVCKMDNRCGSIEYCKNVKNHKQESVVYCFKFCLNIPKYSTFKNDDIVILSKVTSNNTTRQSKNETTENLVTDDSNLENIMIEQTETAAEMEEEEKEEVEDEEEEEENGFQNSNSNESNEIDEVETLHDCVLEEEIVTSPINDSNDTLDSDVLLPANFETNASFLFNRKKEKIDNLHNSNSNDSDKITEIDTSSNCSLQNETPSSPIQDSNDTSNSNGILPTNFQTTGSCLLQNETPSSPIQDSNDTSNSNGILPTNFQTTGSCLLENETPSSPIQDSNDTSNSNEILPTNFETTSSCLLQKKVTASPIQESNDTSDTIEIRPTNFQSTESCSLQKEIIASPIQESNDTSDTIEIRPTNFQSTESCSLQKEIIASPIQESNDTSNSNGILPINFQTTGSYLFQKEVPASPIQDSNDTSDTNVILPTNFQTTGSFLFSQKKELFSNLIINKADLFQSPGKPQSFSEMSGAEEVEQPPEISHPIVENIEKNVLPSRKNESNENIKVSDELENELEDESSENSFVTELEKKIKSNFEKMKVVLNNDDDENTFDICDNNQEVLLFEKNNDVSCEFSLQTTTAVGPNTQNLIKNCELENTGLENLESNNLAKPNLLNEKNNDQVVQENKNEFCEDKFNDLCSHETFVPKDVDNFKKIDETTLEKSNCKQLKSVPKKNDSVSVKINGVIDTEKNSKNVSVVEKEKIDESLVGNSDPETLVDFDSLSTTAVRSESEIKNCMDKEVNSEELEIDSIKHKLLSDENKNIKSSFNLDPVKKIDFNDKELICTDNIQESIAENIENETNHVNLNLNLNVIRECVDTEISSNKSIVVISDTSDFNDIPYQSTDLPTTIEDVFCNEPNASNIGLEVEIDTSNSVEENDLMNSEVNLNNEESSDHLNQQTEVTTENNTINNLVDESAKEEITPINTVILEASEEQKNKSSHKHSKEHQPPMNIEKSEIELPKEKSMNDQNESCEVENIENLKFFSVSGNNTEMLAISKESVSNEPVNIEERIENQKILDGEKKLSQLKENSTENMENVNTDTDDGGHCIATQVENPAVTLLEKENTSKDLNSKSVKLNETVIKNNTSKIICEPHTVTKQLISSDENLISENDISTENSESVSMNSEKSVIIKKQFEEIESTKDVDKKDIKLNQSNSKKKDTSDNLNLKNFTTDLEKRNKISKIQSSKKIMRASNNSSLINETDTVKSHLKNYNIIKNITVYIEKLDEKKINAENQSKLIKKIGSEKSKSDKIKIPSKILTTNLHSNEQAISQINKIEIQNKNLKCFNTHKKKVLKVSLPNEAKVVLSSNLKNDCVSSKSPSECEAINNKNDGSKTNSIVELKNNQTSQEENRPKKLNKIFSPSISNCSIIIEKTESKVLIPEKAAGSKNLESQNTPSNKNEQLELSEIPLNNKSKNADCADAISSDNKNSKVKTVSESEKSKFEKLPRKRKKSFKSSKPESKTEKIQKVSDDVETELTQKIETNKPESESSSIKNTDSKISDINSQTNILPESSTSESVKVTKRPYKRKIYVKNSQVPTRRATNAAVNPEPINSASSKDASQEKIIKKNKIGFCKDTGVLSETCIFNCHLCGEVINTSWTTLRDHFERKHFCEYELCTLGPKLVRCNSISADTNKSKKRKYSENTSANVKRKREDEQPSISIKPSSGVSENQSKCIKCEVEFSNEVKLREHVAVTHRIAKKNFVCLECGENFIVLSNFQAHLKSRHEVEDPLDYMKKNPCCVPDDTSDNKEPELPSNQCRVCMEIFDSKRAVDKHLRVHGITVLNKKNIAAENTRVILNKKLKFYQSGVNE